MLITHGIKRTCSDNQYAYKLVTKVWYTLVDFHANVKNPSFYSSHLRDEHRTSTSLGRKDMKGGGGGSMHCVHFVLPDEGTPFLKRCCTC